MLNLEKLAKKPKVFHALCSLSPVQFNLLLKKLEPLWQKAELKRKSFPGRKRKIGGGRKFKLSLGQALFILLLYYRTYTSHVFIGMVAGIDESRICRYFARLNPLLAQIFKIPQKKVNLTQEEILELIVDATEQETQKRQGTGYSGKKKRQTLKTQIHITPQGMVKSVSQSFPGNIHDKKVYDQTRTNAFVNGFIRRIKKKADLGYQGTECQIPIKKPKGKNLTPRQKLFNQCFAQERIVIEHIFAQLKKFHILSDKFRNKTASYNLIFKNVCGLRNFITA